MKDTFYFSHDYNSRTDLKIKKLIKEKGMRGYGCFWAIIEDLYNNANALQTDYESIAYELREDAEFIKSLVCEYDLFCFEDDFFGSKSVERRLNERNEKSTKARESALSRWNKSERNTNALPPQSDSNAIKERKGKELNESKQIMFDRFWLMYDKKVGDKQKCMKSFVKLSEQEIEKIFNTLPDFLKSITDKQFQPFPQTYINNKRWNDELSVTQIANGGTETLAEREKRLTELADKEHAERMERMKQKGLLA